MIAERVPAAQPWQAVSGYKYRGYDITENESGYGWYRLGKFEWAETLDAVAEQIDKHLRGSKP